MDRVEARTSTAVKVQCLVAAVLVMGGGQYSLPQREPKLKELVDQRQTIVATHVSQGMERVVMPRPEGCLQMDHVEARTSTAVKVQCLVAAVLVMGGGQYSLP
jgi:hypothetical protein